ncbi:sigma-54 interaction domain-containing protein [Tepidibacter formicigenes]|jgi:arginine utilization regulatory protein|uniref:Arginine utilization regulatory protein n=1 Tax=Tepidibacter formicigenes DSM 15518 TaxID=1123349 RepID=A0A1M6MUS8_9FIRM|nr:sigma 54-interacting transcriptional regulator [Tepidibacter formicigenes]SHJ87176.1 arginine utilization regulatory protein [Tepidibacter formicigenes DSM 15518]
MKTKDYLKLMQKILHHIDDGIHVIDKDGNTIIYNKAMANLEGMNEKDVLDKKLLDIFDSLDKESSTLLKALESGEIIENKKQTYLNKYGKEITTINTTIPILNNKEVLGAIEISKNITKIKELSDTILNLHRQKSAPKQTMENKLKKYTFDNIIGESNKLKKAISLARKASKTPASVLIYGETGTGKELFSQSIHYGSDRKDKPFIAQNCAALPESLLEGILFGTSKGGFTGAVDRAGLFEQANGGTLLLDEINSMPITLQAKLLRVLQEGYVRRIGGVKDIPVDVRIIATTNEEPLKLLEENKFRKDLYYRLNVISINIPSLKDRKEDILILAKHFIEKYNKKLNKNVWMLSEKSKEILLNHNWLGNIRELENVIYSAMSMIDDEHVLSYDNLPIYDSDTVNDIQNIEISEKSDLDKTLKSIEIKFIKKALYDNNGNITRAAKQLGIKRQTLQHKIKKYTIK